jgi:hypothetical protein
LPANWAALRAEADRLNPRRICHWCGEPGGSDLDHKEHGDRVCLLNPAEHGPRCQCNLDWIHSRADYEARRSKKNCHGQKTGREGALARRARRTLVRPDDVHPALR